MDDLHRQLGFAEATQRMVEAILQHDDPAVVLEQMVRIVGEALTLDRVLIYDVSLRDDQAVGLCEWLNPAVEVSATKATYPLSLFRAAAQTVVRTRAPYSSHASTPSAELVTDGADRLLHGDMAIKSLYWHPFAFRDDGLYLLVFNQVQAERRFDAVEVAFVERVATYVSLALQKLHLIDEQRRAQQAVMQAQKLESVGLLAGGIAHDFNNLLVGVVGAADVALASLDAQSPTRPIVERVLQCGRLAADLAAQLLVYAGRAPARIERLDVAALAADMIALMRVSMWKEVDLVLDLDPSRPLVDGDRAQLRQLLMNLVVNAAEAIGERPGRITVRIRVATREELGPFPLEPSAPAAATWLRLEVQDDGVGMDAATQARIFDPFFSTKRTGRGLGLAAVQGVVRAHGGAVRVTSAPGCGASFVVALPAAGSLTAAAPPPPAPPPPAPPPAAAPSAPHRVLIVDDDAVVRFVVDLMLRKLGIASVMAADRSAAQQALGDVEQRVDCVVLDLTMPHGDGPAVLNELRAREPKVPVLLMSGYNENEASALLGGNVIGFLQKPFTVEQLRSALITWRV